MQKKREILPAINRCIEALTAMVHDAAKLELLDNSSASKKLKLAVSRFKRNELTDLSKIIYEIRDEINSMPKKTRVRKDGKSMMENIRSVKPVSEDDEEDNLTLDVNYGATPVQPEYAIPEPPPFEF